MDNMTRFPQTEPAPVGAGRQIIHSEYIDLMRKRAIGELPDMGCALRIGEIIKDLALAQNDSHASIDKLIDVGCATGHYYRTFNGMNISIKEYVGIEIDEGMVKVAEEVWREEILGGRLKLINDDIESASPLDRCDVLICANSFMYYRSAKRVLTKFLNSARAIVIRSYFADGNYRIIRGQSAQNNDCVAIDELALFSEAGELLSGDYWTIYGFTYIERLVKSLCPTAKVEWLRDENKVDSINAEARLGVVKRGGTQVIGGYEISYPILQPWEILLIRVG